MGCDVFNEAWLNNERGHRVMGRRLRPYSLWHRYLLGTIYRSPLLIPDAGRAPTWRDLDLATRVCAGRYPERPEPKKFQRARLWTRRLFRCGDAMAEIQRFTDYIADYQSPPEVWVPSQANASTKRPMPAELSALTACMHYGLSLRDAWDMPVGQAQWIEAAYHTNLGANLDFIDDHTRETFAFLRALKAKQRAASEDTPPLEKEPSHGRFEQSQNSR